MNDVERLQNACNAVKDDPERHERIRELLEYVSQADLAECKSEAFHSRIWGSIISGVGKGNINVEPAISDMLLRSWLAEKFFEINLLYGSEERLNAIEEFYNDLIERITQLGVSPRPWAMVTRLLAALFPCYFTTLVSDPKLNEFITKFNKYFPTMQIDPHGSVPRRHRQILDNMAVALDPVSDDDFEQLARRMNLPFRLMELSMEWGKLTPETESTPQNIILYGPPGTGKTYSTTQRALELILGKDKIKNLKSDEIKSRFREYIQKGQIEFVTFHQSYGYEEFVEGLRPVLDEDESNDVRYQLHDGVFKRIALRAAAEGLKKSAAEQDPDFDYLWDRLVEEIREDSERIVTGKKGGKYVFRISNRRSIKTLRCERDEEDEEDNLTVTDSALNVSKKNSKELWEQRSTFGVDPEHLTSDKADEILKVGSHFTPLWIVYKRLLELSRDESAPISEERPSNNAVQRALDEGESESFSFSPDTPKTPQYVLIIDEINRGNMSKILGELITLLEPDKRLGGDNELRLRLPYSPAHRFGVPPNLHILGTMNTADRSIALMDVALRRRFTFEERMPDAAVLENELTRKLPDKRILVKLVVDLFNTLNKRIRFLYDRDHQLGHSYFLNVNSLKDLRRVFIDRVIPLLQEYFYGDWDKICTVLGCPCNEDTKKRSDNEHPIVKVEEFGEVDTLGFDHDEYEDRMDFAVSANFLGDKMTDKDLGCTFLGVLQLKGEEFDTRLGELTGNGSSSDKEDGGEEELEDN